jgi:hypothetical protein
MGQGTGKCMRQADAGKRRSVGVHELAAQEEETAKDTKWQARKRRGGEQGGRRA